jgi:hypothetical protein
MENMEAMKAGCVEPVDRRHRRAGARRQPNGRVRIETEAEPRADMTVTCRSRPRLRLDPDVTPVLTISGS